MPHVHFTTVTSCQVDPAQGVVTIHGRDAKGKEVQATLPFVAFKRVGAEAQRGQLMARRLEAGHRETRGDWSELVPIDTRTFHTASLLASEPAVALIFDKDLESEITFRLSPE